MSEGTKGHTMNRSTVGFFSLGSRLRRRPGVVAVTLLVALIGAIVASPSSASFADPARKSSSPNRHVIGDDVAAGRRAFADELRFIAEQLEEIRVISGQPRPS